MELASFITEWDKIVSTQEYKFQQRSLQKQDENFTVLAEKFSASEEVVSALKSEVQELKAQNSQLTLAMHSLLHAFKANGLPGLDKACQALDMYLEDEAQSNVFENEFHEELGTLGSTHDAVDSATIH